MNGGNIVVDVVNGKADTSNVLVRIVVGIVRCRSATSSISSTDSSTDSGRGRGRGRGSNKDDNNLLF